MSYKTIEISSVASYNILCDGCGGQMSEAWLNSLDDLEQERWERGWEQEGALHFCPGCREAGRGPALGSAGDD